jgi:proline dehydrogenase
VTTTAAAQTATQAYLQTIEQIGLAGVPCKVSVKLSQLGLEIDRGLCLDHLRTIIDLARHHGGFVRIDMEGSGLLDDTLETFAALWGEGHRNIGVVLQSYLHRTSDDLQRVMELGARVRLVKGAYNEAADIAYREKRDVDAAFARQAKTLLTQGSVPAFATHDPRMIDTICRDASDNGIGKDGFEFQMLYGVRRDLQASLAARGYRVRVYVPFGQDWFPYFMRRLAERPANVAFVAKSILYEARG